MPRPSKERQNAPPIRAMVAPIEREIIKTASKVSGIDMSEILRESAVDQSLTIVASYSKVKARQLRKKLLEYRETYNVQ